MTTGMFTTSRNPPSEVTKVLVLTPFGWGGAAGAWASANEASPSTARLATATAKPVALMRHLLEWTARSPSFDCRSRDPRDELVKKQVVDDRHRNADQQRAGHQRAPEIDVAPDQLGSHAQRHRLLVGDGDEGQRIEKVLHRQRERKDHGGDDPWPADRQHHPQQRTELAAAVHHRGFLDLEGHRLEEPHQQPRTEWD